MAEDSHKPPRSFLEEVKDAAYPHRDRSFEYEVKAIEFANSAMRALTFLNGGGLIAIPTVVALFKADPNQARSMVVAAGTCFVAGLLSTVLAQTFAFLTMARRAEHYSFLAAAEQIILSLKHYPNQADAVEKLKEARAHESTSTRKWRRSNRWRGAGIMVGCLSLVCFVAGCYFGGRAVLR